MLGFLNLNKPAGLTSHDCVAKMRRFLQLKRIGHGGTLDPAATGVLPLAVGNATRLLSFLPQEKAYRAVIRLGVRTATDDLEGEIIQTQPVPGLRAEQIKPLLSQFEGKIKQIPPAYSAIQRDGKRLYELARKGEKVEVPSRIVEVNKIEILGFIPGEYPEVEVVVECGPGTYIRAIARDLGEVLGVGGTLAALTRTKSCGLNLSESLTFEQIETQLQRGTLALIPPAIALQHLAVVTLSATDAKSWCQGQRLGENRFPKDDRLTKELFNFQVGLRVQREDGTFLGIGKLIKSDTQLLLIPKIVLPWS